ncbi:MAG: dihydropteroate synthase [Propionibacteriaceae bacterium]|nr:dihydropteroate synthase [Propionibacteriaceae bacterium]
MTLIMGIVNVTPDSFSDGGRWASTEDAIGRGLELWRDGAEILDIGGESTRPGAGRVPEAEEIARVVPVIRELAAAGARVSVDTMRSRVAEAALAAGASIVNDVSGGLADPGMAAVVARSGADYVVMHWRGHSDVMGGLTGYGDVVAEVRDELLAQVRAAERAGVAPERIIVDCGLGFAKEPAHNWELLRSLTAFNELGYRQLVGASRKRFLGEITGRDAPDRDAASAAVTMWCAQHGVWAVRTHSVGEHLDAIRVAAALGAPHGTGAGRRPEPETGP